jgi:hypothetical protein
MLKPFTNLFQAFANAIRWYSIGASIAMLRQVPILVTVFFFQATIGFAQPDTGLDEVSDNLKEKANWNLPLPTMGGMQFWTDYRWFHGWRVQYNSTLNHWRLLDPNSVRRAWGSRQAVLDELSLVVERSSNVKAPTEVVILMHGLMRTASSMSPIETELLRYDQESAKQSNENKPGRTAVYFSYASTRDSIASHSAALRELIENLPGNPKISAVGHSLGNIVFRQAIGEWQRDGDPTNVLPRLNRIVMLGPPNQGSAFAARLAKLGVFETITGNSGMQLGPSWQALKDGLGTPPCPFAIVAGDISSSPLQNPLLDGPSDGVVTLEEATLEGVTEIATVPVIHSFLMSDPSVVRATVSFLSGNGLESSLDSKK